LPSRAARLVKRLALASYSTPGVCSLDTGRRMIVALTDAIQCTMAHSGEWEGAIHQAVRRFVREGDVVLDVGGHVGYSTLHFADWVGSKGRVFVFEPLEENAARIQENVALNGFGDRVEIVSVAVSDRGGEVEFSASSPLNAGMGAIAPNRGGFRVPTVGLDDWLDERGLNRIALVKLDIEGAEALAIRGLARSFTAKRIQSLLLEIHPESLPTFGSSAQDVLDRLSAAGFRLAYWDNIGRFVEGKMASDCLYVLALA
jgi:FkbM family methyltransferase